MLAIPYALDFYKSEQNRTRAVFGAHIAKINLYSSRPLLIELYFSKFLKEKLTPPPPTSRPHPPRTATTLIKHRASSHTQSPRTVMISFTTIPLQGTRRRDSPGRQRRRDERRTRVSDPAMSTIQIIAGPHFQITHQTFRSSYQDAENRQRPRKLLQHGLLSYWARPLATCIPRPRAAPHSPSVRGSCNSLALHFHA